MKKLISLTSLFIFVSSSLLADESSLWLRQMPSHLDMGAGFGKICNDSGKDVFIRSITSDYGKVELHTMVMQNKMMKMKELKNPEIKAKSCMILEPGAKHLMILDIKKQASAGEKKKFLIEFSDNKKSTVIATTRSGN